MGYDMVMVNPPEEFVARRNRYRDRLNELAAARNALPEEEHGTFKFGKNGPEPHGGSERWLLAAKAVLDLKVEPGFTEYFRLNIWGMGRARSWMLKHDILNLATPPAWPAPLSEGHIESDENGNEKAVTEQGAAYIRERDAVLSFRAEGQRGISAHKFGSNDGWLVTPEECREVEEIFDALVEYGETVGIEQFILNFIAWIIAAKDCGGFRVF